MITLLYSYLLSDVRVFALQQSIQFQTRVVNETYDAETVTLGRQFLFRQALFRQALFRQALFRQALFRQFLFRHAIIHDRIILCIMLKSNLA